MGVAAGRRRIESAEHVLFILLSGFTKVRVQIHEGGNQPHAPSVNGSSQLLTRQLGRSIATHTRDSSPFDHDIGLFVSPAAGIDHPGALKNKKFGGFKACGEGPGTHGGAPHSMPIGRKSQERSTPSVLNIPHKRAGPSAPPSALLRFCGSTCTILLETPNAVGLARCRCDESPAPCPGLVCLRHHLGSGPPFEAEIGALGCYPRQRLFINSGLSNRDDCRDCGDGEYSFLDHGFDDTPLSRANPVQNGDGWSREAITQEEEPARRPTPDPWREILC